MLTGLFTRWEFDSETGRFTPYQNETRSFEKMVMSNFQLTRLECKINSLYTTGERKIDCFIVRGLCFFCNTMFEAISCFYHLVPVKKYNILSLSLSLSLTFSLSLSLSFSLSLSLSLSLSEGDIKRGSKKNEIEELRRRYIQEEGFIVVQK